MIWVWIGAALIGLTLGLLGSGGSILTVPVLVYLAGEPAKVAIAESLAIVGAIALVGAVPYAVQRSIDWRSAVFFGIPGIVGTYGGAALSAYVSATAQLVLFAGVMLLAAVLMFRGRQPGPAGEEGVRRQPVAIVAAEGLAVGVLTGLVGVGGGFLIVPALVLLGGLSMRLAVGTSLLIIAAKSFAGFAKYVEVLAVDGLVVDWGLIGLLTAIGIVGSLAGNTISKRVPQQRLRRGFAGFLVVMGLFILWQEVPTALACPPPAGPANGAVADTSSLNPALRQRVEAEIRALDAMRSRLAAGITAQEDVDEETFARVCRPVGMRAAEIGRENGWVVRQIAERYRNPANAPDPPAGELLARFEAQPSLDSVWVRSEAPGWRYLRRITVEATCLHCHGAADERPAFIEIGYPDDRAHGFIPGELRGVYSVIIPDLHAN